MLKIAALTPLLLLAACKAEVREPATGDESVQMKADADGRVAFDLPFAKGEIKLPTGAFSNANFDIGGVKMMPGAKMTSFNLDAGGDRPGKINFTFTAPATPDEVSRYFVEQFRAKGMEASAQAGSLQGKTAEGDNFQMRFAPQGSGTNGTIVIDTKK